MYRYERGEKMEMILTDGHLIWADEDGPHMDFFKNAEGERMRAIWDKLNEPPKPFGTKTQTRRKKKMKNITWYVLEYRNAEGHAVTEHYPTALQSVLAGIKLKRRGVEYKKYKRVINVE